MEQVFLPSILLVKGQSDFLAMRFFKCADMNALIMGSILRPDEYLAQNCWKEWCQYVFQSFITDVLRPSGPILKESLRNIWRSKWCREWMPLSTLTCCCFQPQKLFSKNYFLPPNIVYSYSGLRGQHNICRCIYDFFWLQACSSFELFGFKQSCQAKKIDVNLGLDNATDLYKLVLLRWKGEDFSSRRDEENLKNVVDNKRYKKGCQSSIHNHQSSEIWWIIFQNSTSSFFPSLIIWFTTIFELQERDNPMAATTMRTEEEEWGGLTNILHFSHHFWLFKAMDQSSSSFYSQQRWETDRRFYFHDKSTPNYGKKFSNLHEISFKVQPVFCRHVKHVKTKY